MAETTTGKPPRRDYVDRPFTTPDDENGMGPTLGEDVSVKREREQDAKHGARDIEGDD